MAHIDPIRILIFDEILTRTASKTHTFKHFEGRKPKASVLQWWGKIIAVLEIGENVELEALKLLWRLSEADLRITRSLLAKYMVLDVDWLLFA